MGIIRYLLALSVFLAHMGRIYGLTLTYSNVAVESFFVISGFYMALVLNGKYSGKSNYWIFISNRLLKLLPVYWVLIGYLFHNPNIIPLWRHTLAPLAYVYAVFVNYCLIGLDTILLVKVNSAGHFFLHRFPMSGIGAGWDYMLVPQAWSLGTELWFYFLAPFLVNKKIWIQFVIIILSLAIKKSLVHFGFIGDPWTYRFFPAELHLFLIGSVSFHFMQKLKPYWQTVQYKIMGWVGWLYILCIIVFFEFIPEGRMDPTWLLLISLAVILPFIFKLTEKNKWDRRLGNLSYPLYLCHVNAGILFLHWMDRGAAGFPIFRLLFVTGYALLLYMFIEVPVDWFRQRLVLWWQRRKGLAKGLA